MAAIAGIPSPTTVTVLPPPPLRIPDQSMFGAIASSEVDGEVDAEKRDQLYHVKIMFLKTIMQFVVVSVCNLQPSPLTFGAYFKNQR